MPDGGFLIDSIYRPETYLLELAGHRYEFGLMPFGELVGAESQVRRFACLVCRLAMT